VKDDHHRAGKDIASDGSFGCRPSHQVGHRAFQLAAALGLDAGSHEDTERPSAAWATT
jgi:hypothetical protein